MAIYIYKAKPEPDKILQGEIEAESEQEAVNKLTAMGYFPVSIHAQNLVSGENSFHLRKVSNKEIVSFTSQLSSLIGSGINILNSLNIVSGQLANKYFKAVLSDVAFKIKEGKSLSESLQTYPYLFNPLYTSMVHSGEASGKIDEALNRLSSFLEKEEEFKNSIRQASSYPAFIFAVSCLTVIVLLGFVIPRLVSMFEDMGQVLPLPTKILISISSSLRNYWWLILAIVISAGFVLRRFYNNPASRLKLDEFKLKIPVWGNIVLKTEISRFMRTLSLLITGGMTIGVALDIAVATLDNELLKKEAHKFKEEINKGLKLSDAFKSSKFFPEFTINIISIGEETGALGKSFLRIANDYDKEVDDSLRTLTRMLEPVIILVMGLVVGFIVLSMLLPIFQINLIAR